MWNLPPSRDCMLTAQLCGLSNIVPLQPKYNPPKCHFPTEPQKLISKWTGDYSNVSRTVDWDSFWKNTSHTGFKWYKTEWKNTYLIKNDNTNNLTTRTKKNTCIDKILNYQKIHWVFHVKTIKRKLKNTWTFHSTHLGRRKSLQDQAENVWKSERCFLVKKPTHHTSGNWKELIFKIKRIENWNYLIFLKAKEYFNGAWNQVKEVEWK